MREKNTSIPKYEIAKNYILDLIKNKEKSAHDQIPSEAELMKELQVSSITIRRALSDLVDQGVIYRIRGKGTFVAEKTPKQRKSNLITFVLSGNEKYDSSYMKIIQGMQAYLSQQNLKLVIEFIENDLDHEIEFMNRLIESDSEGALIYSSDPESIKDHLKAIQRQEFPVVLLDRFPIGIPLPCITCNNHDGAFEATNHLIDLGHEKIGFCAYDFHLNSEKERYLGYQHALMQAGLSTHKDLLFPNREINYEELIDKVKSRKLTALFCVNDRRALEVIDHLMQKGIQIPNDLSIIGFDDMEGTELARVPLSTVRQPFYKLGYEAAKLLVEVKSKGRHVSKKMLLPTELILRSSTAKLKNEG